MRGNFTPFISKSVQTTSFNYFSPKDSENLKSLDIGAREVEAERHLKGGWHDFQYFDHKSSWQWDLWENVKKIFLDYKNSQEIQISLFQD